MKRYIYLLRHGNPGHPDDPRRCLGSTDVSLSDYGRRQMEKSKNYIRSFPWTRVYSSPMKRCIQTAECLGIKREELVIKENLREMAAGIWENLTFTEIKEKYFDLYEARGKQLGTFAVEGAESFKEAGERFAACIDEIRRETDEHILVIAHAGVIRGYLCALTGNEYDNVMDFPLPYGGITILKEEDGVLYLEETGIRTADLLDDKEIRRIYKKCRTPENVIAHMEKVAEMTVKLVDRVMDSEGFCEDDRLMLYKAALLHDIRRTEKNHAEKSAAFLRKEGFKEVADIVKMHHSDQMNMDSGLELHEILFYADKLVQDDRIVSIEERFSKSFEKCRGIPEAEKKHRRVEEKSLMIQKKIDDRCGK